MKKYFALFRIQFVNGLQYRVAALAGLSTQFAWGFMEILAFMAFYRANPAAFPMEFSHLVSYIWIQQAFLTLIVPWGGINIGESIITGNIAYDLARPMNLYNRWFCEIVSNKASSFLLRCAPILIVALIIPPPFTLILPPSISQFLMFVISVSLTLGIVAAYCLIDAGSIFYTMSRYNVIFVIAADFFAGNYIPLPFFPESIRKIVEFSPFGAMANMPLRIYSGDIAGMDAVWGISLQLFWFIALLLAGKRLIRNALRRVVTQGG